MVGYLQFIEGFGLRRPGRVRVGLKARFRHYYEEYNIGQVIPVYSTDDIDMQLFVSEGVVNVLDKDKNPTTWQKLKEAKPEAYRPDEGPEQRPLIVQQIKPIKKRGRPRKVFN
ncbi:hypothetical protein KA005_50700 [bacterium]|nr:hypothetical protein [bacterium]